MQYGRSLSAQATARVLYIATGALVFVVLARTLGPGPLGQYAWALTFLALAVALADFGMGPILARDLVAQGEARPDWLANFLVMRLLLGAAVGLGAAVAALTLAPAALRLPLLVCCPLLPLIAARFYDPVFQVGGKPWLSLNLTLVYTALAPLAVVVALVLPQPVQGAILVHAVASVAYGTVGLVLTLRLLRPRFAAVSRAGLMQVALAVAPMGLSSLITALATRVDLFIVARLGSDTMAGQYNAAFRFLDVGAAVIVTVLSPLLTVFVAMAQTDRAALVVAFQSMLRLVATVMVFGALLATGLAGPVMVLVYGAAYASAAAALALLAWKLAAAFVSLLCFALVMATASIRYTVWNSALALGLTVGADLLLVPRLGVTGAAGGTLLGECAQMAVNLFAVSRVMPAALQTGWWGRFALAALPALGVALAPTTMLAAPLLGTLGAALFLLLLALLRGLPGNPLPLLRLGGNTQ
jgi:O-antigen/teichoic acid export membrane protein